MTVLLVTASVSNDDVSNITTIISYYTYNITHVIAADKFEKIPAISQITLGAEERVSKPENSRFFNTFIKPRLTCDFPVPAAPITNTE